MNLHKEGVVFTPENITNFIAKTTIDRFLIEKISNKFSEKPINLDKLFEKYLQDSSSNQTFKECPFTKQDNTFFKYIFKELAELSILDTSVGNGELIIAAFKVIESYFIRLKKLKIIDWSYYQIRKYIISKILYGVDIEYEAVKKTKKRLLSICAELIRDDDSAITLNLDTNYKVGNALVGFVKKPEISFLDQNNVFDCFYEEVKSIFQSHKDLKKKSISETERKSMVDDLKPFHWYLEFPNIISNGGFDIIIQNPPYLSNRQLMPLEKALFEKWYKTPKGLMNTFGMFIERSIDLCHQSSKISNIVHKNLIRSNYYYLLRKFLLERTTIEEIIDLGAGVFDSITAEIVVIMLKPKPPPDNHKIVIKTKYPEQNIFTSKKAISKEILQNVFLHQENYNINLNLQYKELKIINYIKNKKDCDLIKNFEAKTCIATGDDEKYLSEYSINDRYKKTLRGKNIGRYYIDFDSLYLYYNPKILHRARNEKIFLKPEKLIMQTISSKLTVAYDDENYYPLSTCIAIIPKDRVEEEVSIKYLLLYMNSKLVNFYYDFVFNLGAHLTTEISVNNINRIPLILPEEYSIFNNLSDIMIRLNKNNFLRENNKELINYVDKLINVLIYEVAFNQKFKKEALNTNLKRQISQYFNERDKNSMDQIRNCIFNIQNDPDLNREMELIQNHHWVKVIDGYLTM
ncbi:MAG: Eco57I restriction-modification methylase domain-containing protein [Candidatus Hermodarchaeota archaeon]